MQIITCLHAHNYTIIMHAGLVRMIYIHCTLDGAIHHKEYKTMQMSDKQVACFTSVQNWHTPMQIGNPVPNDIPNIWNHMEFNTLNYNALIIQVILQV